MTFIQSRLGPGSHVLVTGGGRGIGAALVADLVRRGHRVTAVARTTADVERVAGQAGPSAHAIAADLADPREVEACAASAEAELGRIDALINNAAILGPIAPIEHGDPAAWLEVQRVNIFGPYLVLRAVLPRMRDGGVVLGITSDAARNTLRNHSAYNTSKAGFEHLHRVAHAEVAPRGIAIGLLDPGGVDTEMMANVLASDFPEAPLFRSMAAAGGLRPPGRVAARIADLLEAGVEGGHRYRMDELDADFRRGD